MMMTAPIVEDDSLKRGRRKEKREERLKVEGKNDQD